MKHKRLILWSVAASLAGFLFGFDTIVISGAEQKIQDLWRLSGAMHGLAVSMALWGTVVGAIFGGLPAEKYGRRKSLICVGFFYFVSAVGSGLAPDVYSFMIARFIGGLGVGAATVVAPMFISEISPADTRGKLAGLFQFNIVCGILVAFISNYLFGTYGSSATAWRWMLGVEALPAAIYTIWTFSLPESPRWLITHARQPEAGADVFRKLYPEAGAEEIDKLVAAVEATVSDTRKTARFWTKRLKIPIMLAFLIALFNQFSGINIIPNDQRAAGTALGSSTHWICAATLTLLFPIAMAHFQAGVLFAFFCFCMCLQLLWVKVMVPETKGMTLEEIEKKLGTLE